jgi:hypothetical protein
MLGPRVFTDFDLAHISEKVPCKTAWGTSRFQKGFSDCSADPATIKQKQLPLLALRSEPKTLQKIQNDLSDLTSITTRIDDSINNTDSRIEESISQILWKRNNIASFINTSPWILNIYFTWKTILLPAFAIIAPIVAIILPFFVLRMFNPEMAYELPEYLERVKEVLLKQITIPSVLRARSQEDRIGKILESLFIGFTLVMFIMSLWNQIQSSLHQRAIWYDIDSRGSEIKALYTTAKSIVSRLQELPLKKRKAIRYCLERGEKAVQAATAFESLDNVTAFGHVWNNSSCIQDIITWISEIDVFSAIASLDSTCIPKLQKATGVRIKDVYHPALKTYISNNYSSSLPHTLLTGPNRGGKSTYCKAVGLAVITAQSWGFAWAAEMSWSPFQTITSALEHEGTIGVASTFEAEIEFAKSVLQPSTGSTFVMMDEIFHSTNAHDGLVASRIFLEKLYVKPNTISVISTHFKELAEQYTKTVQCLQMEAIVNDDTSLRYSYKAVNGISDISSVMEILKEKGLAE